MPYTQQQEQEPHLAVNSPYGGMDHLRQHMQQSHDAKNNHDGKDYTEALGRHAPQAFDFRL